MKVVFKPAQTVAELASARRGASLGHIAAATRSLCPPVRLVSAVLLAHALLLGLLNLHLGVLDLLERLGKLRLELHLTVVTTQETARWESRAATRGGRARARARRGRLAHVTYACARVTPNDRDTRMRKMRRHVVRIAIVHSLVETPPMAASKIWV